jgi:hypothetical protein
MAAELVTPVDELTGLPLPILPTGENLPHNKGHVANWHHHFHPASSPELTATIGGRALRQSRVQLVPVRHHNFSNTAYHRFFSGPPIPGEEEEQFGMCVLAAAGYLPREAIDMNNGNPVVRQLAGDHLSHLKVVQKPIMPGKDEVERYRRKFLPGSDYDSAERSLTDKRVRQAEMGYRNLRYGYDPIKNFFVSVVLKQDLSHIRDSLIDRFVEDGDEEQGMSLLAKAALQAVETTTFRGRPLVDVYKEAWSDDCLHPAMPPHPASLVKHKLGDKDKRMNILPRMRTVLRQGGQQAA